MVAPGRVIGTAGVGLESSDGRGPVWAANADVASIGQRGEVRTGQALAQIAQVSGGPTVLNDVKFPYSKANIDHVLVYGKHVLLIDTKVWKPGRYWTLGVTRRGWEKVPHVDRAGGSMQGAERQISQYLTEQLGRRGWTIDTPLVVVWPSSDQPMNLTFLRLNNGKVALASDALKRLARPRYRKNASDKVVAALSPLVASVGVG